MNLTVSNAGGSNSKLKTNFITVTGSAPTPPVVDFSANVRTGPAPLTVQFTDSSTGNPTSWAWDFNNDGVTDSTLQNPVHTFVAPGTYQVNLTASNAAGSAHRLKGDYIHATVPGDTNPVVDFSGDVRTGTAPLTTHFTDLTVTNPIAWAWDFQNDGIIDSTERNPTHIFDTAGTYQVNLTATNATGISSRLKSNYIVVTAPTPAPVAEFNASPLSGNFPLTVQFTDQSTGTPTSWAWDFNDDGIIDSTIKNPVHTYTISRSYSISLTVANPGGSNTKLKSNYITVNEAPGTSTLSVSPSTASFAAGADQQYDMVVDSFPNGLAGYDLNVTLSNPGIGTITGFSLPSWATLNTTSPVPTTNFEISAVDLNSQVEPGATNVVLFTINVRGAADGRYPHCRPYKKNGFGRWRCDYTRHRERTSHCYRWDRFAGCGLLGKPVKRDSTAGCHVY